jgi:hypothetical protein
MVVEKEVGVEIMKFKSGDKFRIIPYRDTYLRTSETSIGKTGVVVDFYMGDNPVLNLLPSSYEWYVIRLEGSDNSLCPHVVMEKIDPDAKQNEGTNLWYKCLKSPDLVKDERVIQELAKIE